LKRGKGRKGGEGHTRTKKIRTCDRKKEKGMGEKKGAASPVTGEGGKKKEEEQKRKDRKTGDRR